MVVQYLQRQIAKASSCQVIAGHDSNGYAIQLSQRPLPLHAVKRSTHHAAAESAKQETKFKIGEACKRIGICQCKE